MKKEKRTQNTKADKNMKVKFGIRSQIILCFIIPILSIIAVGMFSYWRAELGMETNYTESTVQTLNTIVEYIDYGCEMVESEAFKYAYDTKLSQYYMGLLENDASKRSEAINTGKDAIRTSAVVNPMIRGIYIVTKKNQDIITSGSETQGKGFLEEWSETETVKAGWFDSHAFLDEKLGISADEYALSYYCMSDSGKACVVIDIKQEQIKDILKKLNLGEGAMAAFVTENGREIWTDTGLGICMTEQTFYQDASLAEDTEGYGFQTVNGNKYLFLYSKSDKTGAMVCILVPEETVVSQAQDIRDVTFLIVIVATVIALLLGTLISAHIQKNMKRVVKEMEQVANGNLTSNLKVKGHDEFSSMAGTMNEMVSGTKHLVGKVQIAVKQLESSTGQVNQTAGEIGHYSRNITTAINEICGGMEMQAESASDCLEKSSVLSDDIREVSREVDIVEKQIDKTASVIEQNMSVIDDLSSKSEQANEKTAEVEKCISELKAQTETINNFVDLINDISEQTNLLSLNASIEAARAGDVGKGFAVVAEEIRKLAEGSANAAGEIKNSVEHIQKQMEISVSSTREAGKLVREQNESVNQIAESFGRMKEDMEQMFGSLNTVVIKVEQVDKNREGTLESMETISSVVEETTAAMETLGGIAEKLMHHVEQLDELAGVMENNMQDLTGEVGRFKME